MSRINPVVDLHINKFSGAGITELETGITNGIVKSKEVNGERINYVTQRPAVDIFEDASDQGASARGRAIHYWDDNSALYIFNADTIYKANQGTSISSSPTTGTKKCKFVEIGTKLVLLDAENDEGWVISTADAVSAIASNFPSTLAYGGAVLNSIMYVLDEDGVVYGSANLDPSTWNALDFVGATREPDGGAYLAKHHDNIVVFGNTTIEYFYDAANPSGISLARRQDVSYNIGCSDGETVWTTGDRIFFVGVSGPGALHVYRMAQFGLTKVSSPTIDSFISQAIVKDGYSAMGSGFSANGHEFYLLTLYTTPTDKVPDITLIWDDTAEKWHEWYITANSISKFPLAGWTKREGATQRYGEGILSDGNLVTVNDNLIPLDTLLGGDYVDESSSLYVETGYVVNASDTGTNIEFKVRTGMTDSGSNQWKYPLSYRFVGNQTENSQTLTLKWSNENSANFNTGRTMDTSKYQKITRCGRYRRRNHEFEFSGDEQLRIESLENDI